MRDAGEVFELPPGSDLAVECADDCAAPSAVVDPPAHGGSGGLGEVGLKISGLSGWRQEFVQRFAFCGGEVMSAHAPQCAMFGTCHY